MGTDDVLTDPLALALARFLTGPVCEVYAVLWRLGLVQASETTDLVELADAAA